MILQRRLYGIYQVLFLAPMENETKIKFNRSALLDFILFVANTYRRYISCVDHTYILNIILTEHYIMCSYLKSEPPKSLKTVLQP